MQTESYLTPSQIEMKANSKAELLAYGDAHHSFEAVSIRHLKGCWVAWRKSGCVRAVAAVDGHVFPIFDYDEASTLVDAMPRDNLGRDELLACGYGRRRVTREDIKALLRGVGREFEAVMGRAKAIGARVRELGENNFEYVPYHWSGFSKIEWVAAASVGVAVEFYPKGRAKGEPAWAWCTPERAEDIATVPLSAARFRTALTRLEGVVENEA